MNRFLRDFFDDEEFLSLQIFLKMFELLIKYHEPFLHSFLKTNDLTPELFATPWFLTVFCSKMELSLVYQLWDLFLLENDRTNTLFLGLSMILKEKERFLSSEVSVLPQILTTLVLKREEDVGELFRNAMKLKENTPKSFLVYLRDRLSKKSEFSRSLLEIESYDFLSIFPMEIMHNFYDRDIKCKEKICDICSEDSSIQLKQRTIEKYPDLLGNYKPFAFKSKLPFLIIDFRKEKKAGFLKRSQLFAGKEFLHDLRDIRGNYHLVLLGENAEIYQEFLKEKVEMVSFLGGFEEIHDLHISYGFEMLGHEEKECQFCNKKTKKKAGFLNIFENLFKKKDHLKTEIVAAEDASQDEHENFFMEPDGENELEACQNQENKNETISKNTQNLQETSENNDNHILAKNVSSKTLKTMDSKQTISIDSSKQIDIFKESPPNTINPEGLYEITSKRQISVDNPRDNPSERQKVEFVKTLSKKSRASQEKNKENRKAKMVLRLNQNQPNIPISNPQKLTDYELFLEPKSFPLLQNNKENYFNQFNKNTEQDVKEKLKKTVFSNKKETKYNMTGLFRSISMSTFEEKENLQKSLENMIFSYFLCRKIKEKSPGVYSFRNSIIFITNQVIFCMNFEKNLLKVADRAYKKGKARIEMTENLVQAKNFKLKAFFPLKTLFKISSKKINSSILSFYFKTPAFGMLPCEFKEYVALLEKNLLFKQMKETLQSIERSFKDWQLNAQDNNQRKILWDFITEENARKCIKTVQKIYVSRL